MNEKQFSSWLKDRRRPKGPKLRFDFIFAGMEDRERATLVDTIGSEGIKQVLQIAALAPTGIHGTRLSLFCDPSWDRDSDRMPSNEEAVVYVFTAPLIVAMVDAFLREYVLGLEEAEAKK